MEPVGTRNNQMAKQLAVDIISAYVGNHSVSLEQLPKLITRVYETLINFGQEPISKVEEKEAREPAVPIKKSVTPDYIICLEDGKKFKMLKRHLRSVYGMTAREYRAKWGLPPDYPMVAPNYAKARSSLALQIGLGRSNGRAARIGRPKKLAD